MAIFQFANCKRLPEGESNVMGRSKLYGETSDIMGYGELYGGIMDKYPRLWGYYWELGIFVDPSWVNKILGF